MLGGAPSGSALGQGLELLELTGRWLFGPWMPMQVLCANLDKLSQACWKHGS